jgi:hypothetical protein
MDRTPASIMYLTNWLDEEKSAGDLVLEMLNIKYRNIN